MKSKIRLEGKYAILRNDAITPVPFEGIIYKNVEAAYQAQKCPERAHEFENLMPYVPSNWVGQSSCDPTGTRSKISCSSIS